jgi:hypothetical protein
MPGRGNNTSATSSQDPAPQRRPCAPPPGQKRGSGLIAAGFLNADDGSDDEGERGEPNELRLIVSAARGLTAADAGFFGNNKSSDPYVTLTYRGREKKTAVAAATLNPVFTGEKFVFPLTDPNKDEEAASQQERSEANKSTTEVKITVKDYDAFSIDDFLGEARLDIRDLTTSYEGKWLPLEGQINGTNLFKRFNATGAIYVQAKKVRNIARARAWKPNKPLSPALIKYAVAVTMACLWLVSFLVSLATQILAAVFEALAACALTILVRSMTGIPITLNRLSIRFGAGEGAPSEIVLSGLKIKNPAGGYKSPYLLEIVRMDLHVHVGSFLKARKWVKFAYPDPPKEPGDEDSSPEQPPPKAAFEIDLFRIDGLTLYTEKNTSPLVDAHDMLINTKGFSGKPTPPAEEKEAAVEEESKEEAPAPASKKTVLPAAAHNVPLKFRFRNFQLTDLNLYVTDMISDVLGDPDGVGDVMKQKPVEINHVIAVYDDFHDSADMLWLGEVIGVVMHKIMPKVPVPALLRASMAAGGSKWGRNFSGASSHFIQNMAFFCHGKGGDSLKAAIESDDKKEK